MSESFLPGNGNIDKPGLFTDMPFIYRDNIFVSYFLVLININSEKMIYPGSFSGTFLYS